eukprot:11643861-Alexandrium_andersonii.AAC.1
MGEPEIQRSSRGKTAFFPRPRTQPKSSAPGTCFVQGACWDRNLIHTNFGGVLNFSLATGRVGHRGATGALP